MQKVGSFFFPHNATCGAGISPDKPIELGNYPYPIFVAYASQAADQVYADDQGDDRELRRVQGLRARRRRARRRPADQELGGAGASRRGKGLERSRQLADAQDAHNNKLFKRQQVLAAAWADYGKSNPPSDEKAFLEGWMKARATALAKANMPNGFE